MYSPFACYVFYKIDKIEFPNIAFYVKIILYTNNRKKKIDSFRHPIILIKRNWFSMFLNFAKKYIYFKNFSKIRII